MKIGLIGAQNSHSRDFCEAVNKKRKYDGAVISYIYGGDDPAACKRLCEDYKLIECASEEQVIEKSDAVVITYRRGSGHYKPAVNALKAGKPVFNDKPFTVNLEEAREIAALARELNVPLTGGSSLKNLPGLEQIKKSVTPGSLTVISFAADPGSEYDGYWFYGIHAAELCLTLCGLDFISASAINNNGVIITSVAYPDKTCVLVTSPDSRSLTVSVTNGGQTACHAVPMNYQDAGPEELINMAKTGKPPRGYDFYVKSVELTGRICETAGI
jgi:predicted dehydrogenase